MDFRCCRTTTFGEEVKKIQGINRGKTCAENRIFASSYSPPIFFAFSFAPPKMTTREGSRRSVRTKKHASRVRDVGEDALAHAQAARLARLEDGNDGDMGGDGGELSSDFEDEEVVVKVRPSRKAKRRKPAAVTAKRAKLAGIARHNKPLQQILDSEAATTQLELPRGMVRYTDIEAEESRKPPRRLCSVCGFKAPYSCARCTVRFCSLPCGTIHDDTRCLKFTM